MDITAVTPSTLQTGDLFEGSSSVMGKEDFLRILVTQLKHQDPIDPMKSEDFASQLAEFSSLEQLQNLNDAVESAAEMDVLLNQNLSNTMAASFIGKNVRAVGNAVQYTGDKPVLNYSLPYSAQKLSIDILDEYGAVVRTMELSGQAQGAHTYEWDGKGQDGSQLEQGHYAYHVNAMDLNGELFDGQPFMTGTITGVQYYDGAAWLQVGDAHISMSDVVEITQGESKD